MKKNLTITFLILLGFIILSCCILKIFGFFDTPKTVTFTFDASKDTSFVVERHGRGAAIFFNIDGYLSDSAIINVLSQDLFILDSGKVYIRDQSIDFFGPEAIVKFKHLNNKKGKLTVSATL